MARYGKKLDSIADAFKKDGNLDGVVAVRNEIKRCDTEKTVPAESAQDVLTSIVKARAEYHQFAAKAEIDKNRKILALADNYSTSLDALKKQLTQQDKIDEATEVKQEIERLRASAEVTSAQFTIADLASKAPKAPAAVKSTTPAPAPWTPSSARTPKPAKMRRTVACRGINGEWAKTAMSVKAGDTVTITAKGSWKCTGYSKPCGPDGYEGTELSLSYSSSGYSSNYAWGRHLPQEPYGSVVCKIGESGTPQAVGKSVSFTSEEEGVLYLDSNVAPGRYGRQGCSGTMAVDVEVLASSESKGD